MDALGIDRAVVVGLSMGGMAALHLALRQPQRVHGLVLIDTTAAAETLVRRARYRMLALAARLFGIRPWLLKQASKVMFGATFRRHHPDRVRQWTEPMAGYDPKVIARTLRPVVRRPSVVSRLPTITAPALVIVGDEDQTTPPRESEVMVERLPNARLVTLGATGHMSALERPEQTAALIREFLREIGW
jgi:pimeloyl-ACP methyl ester carboxylesterase